MASEDRLRELEEKYEGYTVYDRDGGKIGKVDDLFVDENDREEYIGVKMGLFGMSGTTLIPMEIARVNEQDRAIEVSESKDRVKDAPHYSDDGDINLAFEDRIRSHFGLMGGSAASGSYDQTTGAAGTATGETTMRGEDQDTGGGRYREPVGQEEYRNDENYVSDSAMGAAAGGATRSGGTGETGDRESGGYREGYAQDEGRSEQGGGEYREESSQDDSQSGAATGAGSVGTGDAQYSKGYEEGYRAAIRETSGQSSGGFSGSSAPAADQGGQDQGGQDQGGQDQGVQTDDREGTGERSEVPAAQQSGAQQSGAQESNVMQEYQSATAGYQAERNEGNEGEGRMRVRRLRRGS